MRTILPSSDARAVSIQKKGRTKRHKHGWIQSVDLEAVFTILRRGYVVAGIFGYIMLRIFTISASILMPEADGSLVVVVSICGLMCAICLTALAIFPLVQMAFVYQSRLLSELVPPPNQYKSKSQRAFVYFKRSMYIVLPYVISTIAIPIVLNILLLLHASEKVNQATFNNYLHESAAISATIGVVLVIVSTGIYWCRDEHFLPLLVLPLLGKMSRTVTILITSLLVSAFFWSVANGLMLIALFIGSKDKIILEDFNIWWLVVAYTIIFIWEYSTITAVLWKNKGGAFGFVVLVFYLLMLIFGKQTGGMALRVAGLGGGIPISGYIKIVNPTKAPLEAGIVHFTGCMVLRTASKTTIQRAIDNAPVTQCHLNPRTPLEREPGKLVSTEVISVNNSDLIESRLSQPAPKR